MLLISHRGNVIGPDKQKENTIGHIDSAISNGFLCEVDVWLIQDTLYLSHDQPIVSQKIDRSIFDDRKDYLVIHCKNLSALTYFAQTDVHYFWHQTDDYTLTSKNWIWCYPGKTGSTSHPSICVMPELTNQSVISFTGVCSDYIERYK